MKGFKSKPVREPRRKTPAKTLTREQQVRHARLLLGRRSSNDDNEPDDIELALGLIGMSYAPFELEKSERAKETKLALRTFLSGLKRAEAARKRLPWPWFHDFDVSRYREECEELLKVRGGPPKREAQKQLLAAEQARRLLHKYGYDAIVTRRDSSGKKSIWLRLAAILYGEIDKDMYHHCCEVLKKDRTRA